MAGSANRFQSDKPHPPKLAQLRLIQFTGSETHHMLDATSNGVSLGFRPKGCQPCAGLAQRLRALKAQWSQWRKQQNAYKIGHRQRPAGENSSTA
jgi:hypothetical protein